MKNKVFTLISIMSLSLATACFAGTNDYVPGQWGFSSDHLPIGAQVKIGDDEFGIASFNVLNEQFKHYINGEPQYMSGSTLALMTEEERRTENIRIVVDSLKERKIEIFCIQEANLAFSIQLEAEIGEEYGFEKIKNGSKDDFGIIVYSKARFKRHFDTHKRPKDTTYIRSDSSPNKYIQSIILATKDTPEKTFTLVNTHAESGKGDQLVNYLNELDGSVLVLGDLNLGLVEPAEIYNISVLNNLTEEYFVLKDHTVFSSLNSIGKLDTIDHILFKGLNVSVDQELTQYLQKTFSLKNRVSHSSM